MNARNGSVAPETNLTAEYDVERAQRLSRTRWWQKVYASVDISTTEEDTQRLHIATSDELEIHRETNVWFFKLLFFWGVLELLLLLQCFYY